MHKKNAEWSKTYVFYEQKNFGSKVKFSIFYENIGKNVQVLTDNLAKRSQNNFASYSISEHSASFSLFQEKNTYFGYGPPVY